MTDRKHKPPAPPVPESPDPMTVYVAHAGLLIPFEIPMSDKFQAAQAGTGFASLIFEGCTIRNTTT